MKNVRLQIEYDGTDFHGWQRQLGKPTIQALLEDNLSDVLGKRVIVYGASRTDSGVHARCQVAHFYCDSETIPSHQWKYILNYRLPRTIRVQESEEVPFAFHSQKDAIEKTYEYRVLNRPMASALDRRVYFYPGKLDWKKMQETLPHFVGTHDFRAFQGAKATVLTTVRTVHAFSLLTESEGLYRFEIRGSGFLKQMVRAILGTVFEVGEGKLSPEAIPTILASKDRRQAGRTLPPYGLCLVCIRYPEYSARPLC